MSLENVTNYDEVKSQIQSALGEMRDNHARIDKPLIYHLDVAAMYPNILLSNRLQPDSVVDESVCAVCDYNRPDKTCDMRMTWAWRGEFFPAHRDEFNMVKHALNQATFPPKRPGDAKRCFTDLTDAEQTALVHKRLVKGLPIRANLQSFIRKVYKKTKDTKGPSSRNLLPFQRQCKRFRIQFQGFDIPTGSTNELLLWKTISAAQGHRLFQASTENRTPVAQQWRGGYRGFSGDPSHANPRGTSSNSKMDKKGSAITHKKHLPDPAVNYSKWLKSIRPRWEEKARGSTGSFRTLPRGHPCLNLYKITTSEDLFLREESHFINMVNNPNVDGVYELKLSLLIVVERTLTPASTAPIHVLALFNPTGSVHLHIVDPATRRQPLVRLQELYREYLKQTGEAASLIDYPTNLEFNTSYHGNDTTALRAISRELDLLENRSYILVISSARELSYFETLVSKLPKFPVLTMPSNRAAHSLEVFPWQSDVTKKMLSRYFASYIDVPIGHIEGDQPLFRADIEFSRRPQKQDMLLWWSPGDQPDLGGMEDDRKIWEELANSEFNAPGCYSNSAIVNEMEGSGGSTAFDSTSHTLEGYSQGQQQANVTTWAMVKAWLLDKARYLDSPADLAVDHFWRWAQAQGFHPALGGIQAIRFQRSTNRREPRSRMLHCWGTYKDAMMQDNPEADFTFPILPGSHLNMSNPCLEFVKTARATFALVKEFSIEVGILKRNLLDLVGVREFADEAIFRNPCEPLKLPVCQICDCEYDRLAIEFALIALVHRLEANFAPQDLKRGKCKQSDWVGRCVAKLRVFWSVSVYPERSRVQS
ncbi:hypothetical protein JB92DRAFT_3092572 [Gautieria morchelliformis]|nr:hypothetical protein JB92DRAFT_3092572 [Gautieria morchelliformis]